MTDLSWKMRTRLALDKQGKHHKTRTRTVFIAGNIIASHPPDLVNGSDVIVVKTTSKFALLHFCTPVLEF